jgi:DNA-binding response OmpR family regulator
VTAIGRPRVLIVEDDPDLLVILKVNLEAAGLETLLASDGRTALTRIARERPDAVLLDVMLPGMDGWAVLEELGDAAGRVPVVVCSAKSHPHDVARATELGAISYVTKPFDIDEVVGAVLSAIDARKRPANPAGLAEAQAERLEGLDPA